MFPNIFCQTEPEITDADLDRPAKDLPLEVIYQLGLKLHDRHATCGDWANLAELLGYGRDKIDEFENQSAAERRSASFLMLKDWTKHTTGRSLYVLRESLRRCRREDCVLYLDQKVIELSSMQLHVKLIEDTLSDSSSKFMTVTTRCDATLKESLENLLGGNVNHFEIDASWNDRASNFKGRHLSIRRSKRPNIISSCESDISSSGEGAIDRIPYNDLSGNRNANLTSPSISTCGSIEQQSSLTRKKIYLSEECIYCGKFNTITRIKPHPLSSSSTSDAWQDVGVNCTSCQCKGLGFGAMIRSTRDLTIESDDELVTSSSDSQPRALRYYCKYPTNSLPTMVKIPVGQQMVSCSPHQTISVNPHQTISVNPHQTISVSPHQTLSGGSQQMISGCYENQQQTYMFMKSDHVKQQINYAKDQTSIYGNIEASSRKFEMQTDMHQFVPHSVPQTATVLSATYTGGLTEQINPPRERSNSEPVPFTAIATLQSQLEFGGTLTKQMILEEQKILSNATVDSPKDTIGDIFSKQFSEEQHKTKIDTNHPPKLPPRNVQKHSTLTQKTGSSPRKVTSEPVYTFPGESKFQLLCSLLMDVPGWWPGETEATVEDSMSFVCKEDGHYMIWYMRSKDTLVLSVSHLSKIIHYAFYTSQDENGETWYYIFPSKSFKSLKDLINHHIENGLDPQAQQPQPVPDSSDGGSFISQQNVRQSRRLVRMLHVRLRYPITDTHLPKKYR